MRRLAAAGLSVLFGLSACASPVPGADGDLTNDWPAPAPVKQFKPTGGACYTGQPMPVVYQYVSTTDCADRHRLEAFYVGEFTGSDADRGTVPRQGTKEMIAAFRVCDAQATSFVGRQWRDLRLDLTVSVPPQQAWQAGARWFQCGLAVLDELSGQVTRFTGSLKGITSQDLLLGCYTYDDKDDKARAISCAQPHNAEYAGVFVAGPDLQYPKTQPQWKRIHDRCITVVGEFLGVPDGRLGAGVVSWPASRKDWDAGDRGVRCLLWTGKATMKTSAKGSKGKGVSFR